MANAGIITLTQTTLSAALTRTAQFMTVASASGIAAPVSNYAQSAYIIGPGQARGELVSIISVSSTTIGISRLAKYRGHWPSGSTVVIGPQAVAGVNQSGMYFSGGFKDFDPVAANATNTSSASTSVLVTPWINVDTGYQWIWSTVVNAWVPGWGNPEPKGVSDAVASVAGLTVPSGPLFHITGTNAITGFTLPVGFTHGEMTVIPDGIFTWTTATNIALAGTAVVSKIIIFAWDPNAAKWYPSVVA